MLGFRFGEKGESPSRVDRLHAFFVCLFFLSFFGAGDSVYY